MIICAIDPGQKGGVAVLEEDKPRLVCPLPMISKIVDAPKLYALLSAVEPTVTYIERQSIRQGQGGALTIGTNYGRILATVEILGFKHDHLNPATWKKRAGFATKLTGKEKKEAAYELVRRTFGEQVIMDHRLTVSKDGLNEAMLMAYFA